MSDEKWRQVWSLLNEQLITVTLTGKMWAIKSRPCTKYKLHIITWKVKPWFQCKPGSDKGQVLSAVEVNKSFVTIWQNVSSSHYLSKICVINRVSVVLVKACYVFQVVWVILLPNITFVWDVDILTGSVSKQSLRASLGWCCSGFIPFQASYSCI